MEKLFTIYTDSNGVVHKIHTGTYPEQCDEFYRAREEGDTLAMHFLALPFIERDPASIQSEIYMIELAAERDRQMNKSIGDIAIEMRALYGRHGIDPYKVEPIKLSPIQRLMRWLGLDSPAYDGAGFSTLKHKSQH